MTFTIQTVAKSLADYLSPLLPGVTFYEDPNQQGSEMPCAFLQQRFSYLELRTGGRWLRRVGLDLTCLEDYNLPDLQGRYPMLFDALHRIKVFRHSGDHLNLDPGVAQKYKEFWADDTNGVSDEQDQRFIVQQRSLERLLTAIQIELDALT